MDPIHLTQFSHGAGCGCKLSPAVLHEILSGVDRSESFPSLLIGNDTKDDAAVMDLGDGTGIISTTDFFMPIVDDPRTFGRIAAANAISDVYAMGGEPLMAIAILGWPLGKIPESAASAVLDGGRSICSEAKIPLAGGHSIDSPEPIFGLAVTGRVKLDRLKANAAAKAGDHLFLTKAVGVGMVTTAQKKGLVTDADLFAAVDSMQALNMIGTKLSQISAVHAMTDVTGFGLLGHLVEMCEGAKLSAKVDFAAVPMLSAERLKHYHSNGCVPGGSHRNWASYGQHVEAIDGFERDLLCDPQTSGGLLISVGDEGVEQVEALLKREGLPHVSIGQMDNGLDVKSPSSLISFH
ncbi:MAG: selenide, water dikinase SelD [Crocinitomicaceae bacterium]|jgi:selenide,water dikinase|nr:selenide, water dikinase SelD [Crocinitomicaceae bacterium]